jgi:cell division protease FtsH
MSDHHTRPSESGGNAANDGAKGKSSPTPSGDAFLPPVRRQGDLINQPPEPPSRKLRRPAERARRLNAPRTILGKPGKGNGGKSWPVWLPYVLVGLLLLLAASTFITSRNGDSISYDAFLSKAKAGEVAEASFTNGTGAVRGKLVDGTRFTTSGPDQLSVEDRADLRAVSLTFRSPGRSIWEGPIGLFLPILMVFGLLTLMSRRSSAGGMGGPGGVMQIGKSRAKLWTTERPNSTFADIAGYEGVKTEMQEVIDALRDPARFAEIGARSPKGVLLVGPPGTGKTLFARAMAGEAKVSFISVTGSDFMEMFVGVGASRVRDLFATARLNAPCVVFIDEIDGVGRKRGAGLGGGHDEREQTLNQMLSEMDGFDPSTNVIVLAATNRPDVLDAALLRPGRFDRQIVVPLPDLSERLPILKVHAAHRKVDATVDFERIARATPGMSGADLANLVNEAALGAIRRGAPAIGADDFSAARDRILIGAVRDSLVLSDHDKETTAYHEAGHALLAHLLDDADPVEKVTIIPRGMALGVTMQLPVADRHSYTQSALNDRLCVSMGGRCAEQIVYNQRTTGASNDLMTSTELARRMVREWGMSPIIGPMAWGGTGQVFLGEDLMTGARDHADDTARRIDAEIETILRAQEARAMSLLTEHRESLNAIAQALIERETISGEDITLLLAKP